MFSEEAIAQLDEEPTSASLSVSPVTPYSVEVLLCLPVE